MGKIDYNEILNFAVDMAINAGELIKEKRDAHNLSVEYKDKMEIVTSADIASDELITTAIKERYPEHSILSEELSPDLYNKDNHKYLWIVDPIDGTVNYAHNLNQVSISIAFAVEGTVKAGVVHAPFQNETFTAVKGKGAFSDYSKIHCSVNSEPKTAIIATGFPYDKSDIEFMIQRVRNILSNFQDIRRFGSAALDLCWTACGRFDGYYETVKPWDMAAGCLIAKEAGCIVGNLNKSNQNIPEDLSGEDLVVAAPAIYSTLVKVLQEVDSM